MGYRKIPNLYKDVRILDFKECYALEKIHGTSAHVKYKDDSLHFFSGGMNHETFLSLFDQEALLEKFRAFECPEVIVFGEGYGGKEQGMRETYGDKPAFIAFEVKIGDVWQYVSNAHEVVLKLGLEFVHYEKGPATIDWLNEQMNAPSVQAKRNGITEDKLREGVVIRPIKEYRDYRGNRIITKHKHPKFSENKTKREIDPEKLKVLSDAVEVAEEWVTPMRLEHVLDKLPEKGELKHIPIVIKAMIEDIKLEGEDEIIWSKPVEKAIGKVTALMYKKKISLI